MRNEKTEDKEKDFLISRSSMQERRKKSKDKVTEQI